VDTVLPVNEKIVYCSKRKKRRFCDHCDRLVSIRTFNAHKRRKTVDDANIFDYTDELPIQIQATWILTLCYQAMNVPKLQNLPPKVQNFKESSSLMPQILQLNIEKV
ncbi:unnamed protein product, partial [Pocillopora meandrina]